MMKTGENQTNSFGIPAAPGCTDTKSSNGWGSQIYHIVWKKMREEGWGEGSARFYDFKTLRVL